MTAFQAAIAAFDEYNKQDPNKEMVDGTLVPRELLYAQRMTFCMEAFAPDAAEEVLLAARCQHIGRWQIPRNTYPDGRVGYLQWRNRLKDHHVQIAHGILQRVGYDDAMKANVGRLLLKKDLKLNPDAQLLEDVVCLVFIEHYLADFMRKHDEGKVVSILQKTMKKMSARGRSAALKISVPDDVRALISRAGIV